MADDNSKIDYIANRLDHVADKVDDLKDTLVGLVTKFEMHVEREDEDRVHVIKNTNTLNTNTVSLQEHMKRTAALEEYVRNIEGRFTPVELDVMRKNAINAWIKAQVIFLGKIGGALTALGAIAAAVKLLLNHLS